MLGFKGEAGSSPALSRSCKESVSRFPSQNDRHLLSVVMTFEREEGGVWHNSTISLTPLFVLTPPDNNVRLFFWTTWEKYMKVQPKLRRACLFALPLGLALLLLVLMQSALVSASAPNQVHEADVVVDLSDGRVMVRHITFTEPITGLTALQLTGLDLTIADTAYGPALCAIEGVGCPADNCFCDANLFWNYLHWDGAWASSMEGLGTYNLPLDGAVEGYVWGPWGATPPEVTPEILAAQAGLQWLRAQQMEDGGYGSNAGAALDTLLAIGAAGEDVQALQSAAGNGVLDYLRINAGDYITGSAARAGKLALALAAVDLDPRDFAGMDLAQTLQGYYDPITGSIGVALTDQIWGMLGWRAAGELVPVTATQYLASLADPDDGGWGFGWGSDLDMTALGIEALVAGGEPLTSTAIISAVDFLRDAQGGDGGFVPSWLGESNTNSTAWAVQGLLAAGEDPLGTAWTTVTGSQPISYLLGMQLPEGAFAWKDLQEGPDLLATQQSIPALLGKPFPLLSREVALRRAVEWIGAQQLADGSFPGFGTGATIDAILAIAAAGYDPQRFVSTGGQTPLGYLTTQVPTYPLSSAAAAGKLAVGVVAAGGDPQDLGGFNLVISMTDYYDPASGAFGASTWDQAWSMLGWVAAGQTVPVTATHHLIEMSALDGGWGFMSRKGSLGGADPDSTGLALQALAAAGVGHEEPAVQAALGFLRSVQNYYGGFPGYAGTATSPNSTGLALQGLAAYGEDPRGLRWTRTVTDGSSSRLTLYNPLDSLMALQTPQGGFPGYGGPNDLFATTQAVPGIAGKSLPLRLWRVYLPLAVRN